MITARSGRGLYDSGVSLPGVTTKNDEADRIVSGYVAGDLPFGRFVNEGSLESDNEILFDEIDDTDTKSGGVSCYSFDAIAAVDSLKYSANEPAGIKKRGYIAVECFEDIPVGSTSFTVVNGAGATAAADIGKIGVTTGLGYSVITGIEVTRKFDSTMVEVHLDGPITLVAGS